MSTTTDPQLLRLAGSPPSGWEHRGSRKRPGLPHHRKGDVVRTHSHYKALLNDKLKSEFNLVFTSSSALCKCPTQNGIHILPDGYKHVTGIFYKLLRNNTKPRQQLYSNGHTHPSNLFLPIHSKSQARLSDFTFTFHFHALEKEMATHSSILAWRFPRTEEPSGLLSMGSHRVGHD